MLLDNHANLYLRDLEWVVRSPSLITGDTDRSVVLQPFASSFDSSQVDLEHLRSFLDRKPNHRVGRYFERLVLYWIKFICGFEVVASSHAIRRSGRTVGELDLLFRDERGRLTHWELAVKFFLYYPKEPVRERRYIGPNPADRLDLKIARVFEHQLELSRDFFPEVEQRAALIKGRIFYPDGGEVQNLDCFLTRDHLRGTWLHASQIREVLSFRDSVRYQIQRKPHWLSAALVAKSDAGLMTAADVASHIAEHFARFATRPLLISQLSERPSHWLEESRFFVVDDSWPELP